MGKNFRRGRISLVINRGFRMGKDFRSGRISLVVNRSFRMGKDFRSGRISLVVNRSFRMGKDFRRSRIPLVISRGFRMGKDFRSGRIRFFLPSPPHDFPCPFRIAIGFDTCLEALPTDSSLDSTSPARQTRGRLPASHSFRIATDSQPSAMPSRRKDDRGTCVHFRFFRNRE